MEAPASIHHTPGPRPLEAFTSMQGLGRDLTPASPAPAARPPALQVRRVRTALCPGAQPGVQPLVSLQEELRNDTVRYQ